MRLKLAVAFLMMAGATIPVALAGSQPVSAAGKLSASERRCFEVSGDPGGAALVNLTPVLADAGGDGQLVSSDVVDPPVASNVNFRPGVVDPNVAVTPIGADGEVCFVNSVHTNVHLVADHLGTIASSAYTPAKASGAPDRRVDTRSGLGGGKLGPSGRRCFSVSGNPGDAAIVNLTPVLADEFGDGQLVSSDVQNPPVASNVNFGPGSVDPNVAIAKIGSDGQVCFVNSVHTRVHLVADHLGTIAASAYASAKASGAPDRRVDTRIGQGGGKIGPSGRRCFSVSGGPGDAALVNLTPVLADGGGDGQLVSSDVTNPPVASNVNFRPGSVDPNVAIAPIGADGKVCYVNSTHTSVHLVADHLGTISESAYASAKASGAPDRRVDTRLFGAGIAEGITAGEESTCALRVDRTVACWGLNNFGQASPLGGTFRAIESGDGHTCGLRDDLSIDCWGFDVDGSTRPPAGAFSSVSGGYAHTCGLRETGDAECWGWNLYGQTNVLGGGFAQVIAVGTSSCGLRVDGAVECWGEDAVLLSNSEASVVTIAGGREHLCGLRIDGTATCWGVSAQGAPPTPTGKFTAITAGYLHTCGLRPDGSIECWGTFDAAVMAAPTGSFVAIAAGKAHTCGVRSDRTVACWGLNNFGQASPPPGEFLG